MGAVLIFEWAFFRICILDDNMIILHRCFSRRSWTGLILHFFGTRSGESRMIQWSTLEVTRVPRTQKQKKALLPHIEKNNKLRVAAVVTSGVSLYHQFGGVFDAYMGSRKQLYKTWGGQAGGSGKGLFDIAAYVSFATHEPVNGRINGNRRSWFTFLGRTCLLFFPSSFMYHGQRVSP